MGFERGRPTGILEVVIVLKWKTEKRDLEA